MSRTRPPTPQRAPTATALLRRQAFRSGTLHVHPVRLGPVPLAFLALGPSASGRASLPSVGRPMHRAAPGNPLIRFPFHVHFLLIPCPGYPWPMRPGAFGPSPRGRVRASKGIPFSSRPFPSVRPPGGSPPCPQSALPPRGPCGGRRGSWFQDAPAGCLSRVPRMRHLSIAEFGLLGGIGAPRRGWGSSAGADPGLRWYTQRDPAHRIWGRGVRPLRGRAIARGPSPDR